MVPLATAFAIGMPASLTSAHPRRKGGCHWRANSARTVASTPEMSTWGFQVQNRYVGDVGDFGKYGLLRRLTGMTDPETPEPDLKLGVVWYLHPDECGNADGGHIGYLRPTNRNEAMYGACDPDLRVMLRALVEGGRRYVRCVQRSPILPEGTLYYDALLHYPPDMLRPIRVEVRARWLAGALRATVDADVVYLDPDTGIASDQMMYRKAGPKYTYMSDLRAFWERGQSLVIYHSLGRSEPVDDLIRETAALICDGLGTEPISLRYKRGSPRVFYVVSQPAHTGTITERIDRMLASDWCRHFEAVR